MEHIWLICLFTFLIHTTETLSYAIRLAGVRMGNLAVALSLTGIIVLVSRTSNMLQAPFTGALVDQAIYLHLDVAWHFRFIIAAASVGTAAAILLFPTFVPLSQRLIAHLEIAGSIPRLLKHALSLHNIKQVGQHIRLPRLHSLSRFRIKGIPKRLLLMNCFVTAVYTVSVLSTLYASLLAPAYEATILMSSGLVNGFATIILTLLVDPQVALLTDKAMKGQAEQSEVRDMYLLLMISRFLGTLVAQLLFIPAAYWVAWIGPWFH